MNSEEYTYSFRVTETELFGEKKDLLIAIKCCQDVLLALLIIL